MNDSSTTLLQPPRIGPAHALATLAYHRTPYYRPVYVPWHYPVSRTPLGLCQPDSESQTPLRLPGIAPREDSSKGGPDGQEVTGRNFQVRRPKPSQGGETKYNCMVTPIYSGRKGTQQRNLGGVIPGTHDWANRPLPTSRLQAVLRQETIMRWVPCPVPEGSAEP